MYRFSRSIYRELAPYVVETPQNGSADHTGVANGNGRPARNGHANGAVPDAHENGDGHAAVITNRQRMLEACEAAMRRLAYDRRYFAHPARSLFGEIRIYFPIHEQDRVFRVVERYVNLAIEHLARLPADKISLDGQPSECRAHTRKGTPCQRQPLPGRDYCPSHQHLEESLEPFEEVEALDGRGDAALDAVGSAA